MNINKSCRLFLRDIYLYDISACHYSILEQMGVDLSNIDKNDKLKRNTQIGLMMRDDPNLVSVLRNITDSTINEYLLRNHIKEEEIIIRQYDGIITTKKLQETTDRYLPLDLRSVFDVFIVSIDRQRYISLGGTKVSIKGVSHRYDEMDKFYKRLVNINYLSKTSIFKSLQRIKDEILTSENPMLFCIPNSEDHYNIFLKRFGEVEVSGNMARVMDVSDIDKQRYFDFFLRPFTESIVLEFA